MEQAPNGASGVRVIRHTINYTQCDKYHSGGVIEITELDFTKADTVSIGQCKVPMKGG